MATGDIGSVVDTLEFDTSKTRYPDIIHVSGDVFAVAYEGVDGDGFVVTFTVDDVGQIGAAVIDSLEFETTVCSWPRIVAVAGDIYAIMYTGPSITAKVVTVSIDVSGNIGAAVVDSQTFLDADLPDFTDIIHVSGDVFAGIYTKNVGGDDFGKVFTFEMDSAGTIGAAEIDTLEYDTTGEDDWFKEIIHVAGNIFVIAHQTTSSHGMLTTVQIQPNGQIAATITDSLDFDSSGFFDETRMIHVTGVIYALVRTGAGSDGFITTFTIQADGSAITQVDDLEFDTANGNQPRIVNVGGQVYGIAYSGTDSDGFLKTVTIQSDGTISAVIDTLEFDTDIGQTPSIINVPDSDGYVVIAYWGTDNDGWAATAKVDLVSNGGNAPYREHYVLIDWDDDGDFGDTFEDISDDVQDIYVKHGKDRELNSPVASFASVTVKNSDHKYSKPNTSSPLNTGGNTLRSGHKIIIGEAFPFDDFTDTDGVGIESHTPNRQYGTEIWSEESGTFVIDTNQLKETGGVGGIATMDLEEASVHLSVQFKKGANNDGILVWRFTDTSNFLYVRTDGTNLDVRKVDGGADSSIATGALAWSNNDTKLIKVILHGENIFVLADRVLIVNTSSTFSETITKHGLGGPSLSTSARFDKWAGSFQLFYGTLDRIQPLPDQVRKVAVITASNDFKILAKLLLTRRVFPINGFPNGTNEIVEEILTNNATKASQLGFIFDTGETVSADGNTKAWWNVRALDICLKTAAEENGFFYQDQDGLYRFEKRAHRTTSPHDASTETVYEESATNGKYFTNLQWLEGDEDILNLVTASGRRAERINDDNFSAEIWRAREADVIDGGVSSSGLSLAGSETKVVYFESPFDAIAAVQGPVSTTTEVKIAINDTGGAIVNGPFAIGELVTGDTSTATGRVTKLGAGFIIIVVKSGTFTADEKIFAKLSASGVTGASINDGAAAGGSTLTNIQDFQANAQADGAGADKTSQLAVTLTPVDSTDIFNFGKGGKLTLVNSDTDTIYVTRLRVLGDAYKLQEKITATTEDAESQRRHGEKSFNIETDLFTTFDELQSLTDDIEAKEDSPRAKIVYDMVNGTKESTMSMFARRLSDKVTLVFPAMGINEDFFINQMEYFITQGNKAIVTRITAEEES